MLRALRVVMSVWLAIAMLACVGERARGDAFLEEANRAASATPGTLPAEDVLFPAMAEMEESPSGNTELWDIITLPEGDPLWRELSRWAAGETQQAVLEALGTVADPEETYVLGIAYDSASSAPEEWVAAGLVSSIGPGGELGTIGMEYLDSIDTLTELALVDAKRRAMEGDGQESLDVLVDLVRFGRIMAYRPSTIEKRTASAMMSMALERMRDVVYSHPDAFTSSMLNDVIIELDDRTLRLNRIDFPVLERLAAEQALERAFVERGGVRPVELATILTKSNVTGTPLRSFSEFAWYEQLASQHAGWFDTKDRIEDVWRDFQTRWNNQNWNLASLRLPTDWAQTEPSQYALIREFGGVDGEIDLYRVLSNMRLRLVMELRGTFNALGVVAFEKDNRSFPPVLQAIQPRYVSKLAFDPYNWNEELERQEDFGYFVPIRDQRFGPRELPQPYRVMVGSRLGGIESGSGMDFSIDEGEFDFEGDFGEFDEDASMQGGMSLIDGGEGFDEGGGIEVDPDSASYQIGSTVGLMILPLFMGEMDEVEYRNQLEILNGQLAAQGVPPIPEDVMDVQRGRIRATPLREWAVRAIRETPAEAFETAESQAPDEEMIQWLEGKDLSPASMRREAVSALEAELQGGGGAMLQMAGIRQEQIVDLVGDVVEDLAGRDELQKLAEDIRSGSEIPPEQTRESLAAIVDVVLKDDYVNRMQNMLDTVRTQLQQGGGLQEMMMASAFAEMTGGAAFPVLLDDSVFLLYSMGPDGTDDLAASVGVGGADVLIWPPLSSLEREQR